ncbi:hypothetical protein D9M69_709960 [compost metagenome]
MLACLIALPHICRSAWMKAANSAGVSQRNSPPYSRHFFASSSDWQAFRMAALSFSRIGFGVPAGARMPCQAIGA